MKKNYLSKKHGYVTFAAVTSIILLFCSCNVTENPVDEFENSTSSVSKDVPNEPDELVPNTQDDTQQAADCEDNTSIIAVPDDAEKAVLMETYELSEEEYNSYLTSWLNPGGGQEAGMTLEEWIVGMQEQAAVHSDPDFIK